MTTVSDAELLSRTALGDREAFADLVSKYQKPVRRYLTRLVGAADHADDLAQEAFVRLFQAAPRYQLAGSAAPLLYRIATNLARSHERWRRRWRFMPMPESRDVTPRSASPHATALASELREELERSLQSLPLRFRSPLVLHEIEGLSYQEIGRILGCPENTVRSRISRGRAGLKRRMEPYVNGGAHAR